MNAKILLRFYPQPKYPTTQVRNESLQYLSHNKDERSHQNKFVPENNICPSKKFT